MAVFVPRQRKHKARQRQTQSRGRSDSNVAVILPASKAEKDERRHHLRQELLAQNQLTKASGKKKKRLDKYIDSKLRKEDNKELIRKLSEQKIDRSLLRSSKNLGRGSDTIREALSRALQQARAGIDLENNNELLFKEGSNVGIDAQASDDTSTGDEVLANSPQSTALEPQSPKTNAFGSGLKRPPNVDVEGNPIIQTRKRLKITPKSLSYVEAGESDWEGFHSDSQSHEDPLEDSPSSDNEEASNPQGKSVESYSSDPGDTEMSSSGSDEDQSLGNGEDNGITERQSAFKAWATQQRNQAIGFVPSKATDHVQGDQQHSVEQGTRQSREDTQHSKTPRQMNEALKLRTRDIQQTAFHVAITRSADVENARSKLPIVAEEQNIMETIRNNDCTIICGETGSGKTTQVPQFLLEAGYGCPDGPCPGLIGVTQPRRVAAVSMARRVAQEIGDLSDKVSYQVRFDSSVSSKTALKFMTDGILLREVSQNFLLSKYSVIVIDEAHERSVNTDILISILSRIVATRRTLANESVKHKPLKLIIMSATLKITDFTMNSALFQSGPPPIVQVEGRQYEVTVHFSKKTRRDYVEEAFEKTKRGHRKLPPGGMLVFLTGQSEIDQVAKLLRETFVPTLDSASGNSSMRVSATEATIEGENIELGRHRTTRESSTESDVSFRGVDNDDKSDQEDDEFNVGDEDSSKKLKVHVLPLFSQLPAEQQMRVFEAPPLGSRLIVLATNIAETSLTIPGIRYVIDCGRAKEKRYDPNTGIQSFAVDWISKANASQRAGRAGRTGPGHCYRLYSSAVYERDFAEHPLPEIQRTPVEGVVLQLKSMGIPNTDRFPFPSPPNRNNLLKAERLLEHLGALSDGRVTLAGRELSVYPLSPRLSRILAVAQNHDCLDLAVALVAALAVPEIFVPEARLGAADCDPEPEGLGTQEVPFVERRHKHFGDFHKNAARLDRHSDAIKMLTTVCDFTNQSVSMDSFKRYTRIKALQEILQLREQLHNIVSARRLDPVKSTPSISPPNSEQVKVLRFLVAAGYIDQIAQRADLSPTPPAKFRKSNRAIDVPYITLFSSRLNQANPNHQQTDQPRSDHVYIHASSVVAHVAKANLPQFIVYSHLSQAPTSTIELEPNGVTPANQPRIRMHPLVPVSSAQIISIANNTPLLGEGKPVGKLETLERTARSEERRACWTVPFLKGEAGGVEWPLPPARRIVQRRLPGKGWINEESLAA